MTMFYICALIFAPMLLMGMLPSANAQEDAKDTSVTGPGKLPIQSSIVFSSTSLLTCIAQSSVLISEPPTPVLVS